MNHDTNRESRIANRESPIAESPDRAIRSAYLGITNRHSRAVLPLRRRPTACVPVPRPGHFEVFLSIKRSRRGVRILTTDSRIKIRSRSGPGSKDRDLIVISDQ